MICLSVGLCYGVNHAVRHQIQKKDTLFDAFFFVLLHFSKQNKAKLLCKEPNTLYGQYTRLIPFEEILIEMTESVSQSF